MQPQQTHLHEALSNSLETRDLTLSPAGRKGRQETVCLPSHVQVFSSGVDLDLDAYQASRQYRQQNASNGLWKDILKFSQQKQAFQKIQVSLEMCLIIFFRRAIVNNPSFCRPAKIDPLLNFWCHFHILLCFQKSFRQC